MTTFYHLYLADGFVESLFAISVNVNFAWYSTTADSKLSLDGGENLDVQR